MLCACTLIQFSQCCYKMLPQPENVNLTECGRINGTLCFILKILFNEYGVLILCYYCMLLLLVAATLSSPHLVYIYLYMCSTTIHIHAHTYFNTSELYVICNAFPVSKHHLSDIDIAFPILISHKQIWLIGEYILIFTFVSLSCSSIHLFQCVV